MQQVQIDRRTTRLHLAKLIAESIREACPEIVPVYKLRGNNDKTYTAFQVMYGLAPEAVRFKEPKYVSGYQFRDGRTGNLYGKPARTAEELAEQHEAQQEKNVRDYLHGLLRMNAAEFQREVRYYKNKFATNLD